MTDYEVCDKYEIPYKMIECIYTMFMVSGENMTFEDAVKRFLKQL